MTIVMPMLLSRSTQASLALCAGLLAMLAMAPLAPAQAQVLAQAQAQVLAQADTQYLVERINRLENDLRFLQRQVSRGGSVPQQNAPGVNQGGGSLTQGGDEADTSIANRLSSRIDQLEGQIRELVGRFEEVEFRNGQTQRRMDKLVEDVDFRLNELEKARPLPGQAAGPAAGQATPPAAGQATGPAAGTTQATAGGEPQQLVRGSTSSQPGTAPTREGVLGTLPTDSTGRPLAGQAGGAAPAGGNVARATPPAAAAPATRLPAGTPKERYDFAFRLLAQADYPAAETAFKEFLAAHGSDPLAGNAQYWLGETYYVRQQFEPAAAAFLQGYQGYPKGPKASDSLLKLGMTLTAMKKTAEACAAYGQLAKEFPSAPANVKEALVRERAKANCR